MFLANENLCDSYFILCRVFLHKEEIRASMDMTRFSYPLWMQRILQTNSEQERVESIVARYAHLVYTQEKLLDAITLEDLTSIGEILLSLPHKHTVLCEPYSFGDLYLPNNSELQKKYNALSFPLQCRALDVAQEYVEAEDFYALIALDWNCGTSQLISLAGNENELRNRAIGFIDDPLTSTMVDPTYEIEKTNLLQRCRQLLEAQKEEETPIGIYTVSCSGEFYANNLYVFPLDCHFSLTMKKTRDDQGRFLPQSISEADEDLPC